MRGVPAEEADAHYVIQREVEEIQNKVEYESKVRGGWLDCFRVQNKTLYRTLLGASPPSFVSPDRVLKTRMRFFVGVVLQGWRCRVCSS